jgi:hypothetical protein
MLPGIALACCLAAAAQNRITFRNNVILINGTPFFPVGWCQGYELDSLPGYDMPRAARSGANTVMSCWFQGFSPEDLGIHTFLPDCKSPGRDRGPA